MADYSKIIQLLSINGERFDFKLDEGAIVTELIENSSVLPDNNTFDAEWLDKSIQDIINGNYNTNIFRTKISNYINRFDFKGANFKFYEYTSAITKAVSANININLILPENRKRFKQSKYYNKIIGIKELENDREIFSLVPRVIINGEMIENFRVFCNESVTDIILELGTDISNELFKTMQNEDIDVSILTFPRSNEYEEQRLTKNVTKNNNESRLRRVGARLGRVLTVKSDYFQIPLDKGLVHPENILVFSNDRFVHGAKVESYYPNIYRVVNTPEHLTRFTLYIFYNGAERFIRNELALYHDNVEDICLEYYNNTIPKYIKEYLPIKIDYSIKNFMESKFKFPIEYKVDVLQKLIDFNASYAKEYLKYYNVNNTYYLDMENTNLQSKIRLDNKQEMQDESKYVKFNESRYVFIFKKDLVNHNRAFRIFIDGEYYIPDHVYDDLFYDFIYVPTTLIKQDSIFSIEMVYDYVNSLTGIITDYEEEFVLTLGEFSENVVAKDIKMICDGERIPSTAVKAFIETDAGMVPFNLDSNTHIGNRTIYIRISDSNLYGQPVKFLIEKHYTRITHNYSDIIDNTIEVPAINEENVNNVMVYKNSRLLANKMYKIGKENDKYIIELEDQEFSMYDNIHIEINPYFSNEVVFVQQIPTNGFIDLYEKIDKPLDTRWYDLYLNGRRLEDNNIKIISPYKAIIHNVKSLINFVVIEKNRDAEYFSISNKNIEDLIWENEDHIRTKHLTTKIVGSEEMFSKS